MDLCEDDNIQIRRQAIKDLPLLCKDTVEHVERIADTLSQLLVVEDQLELQQVHMSLQQLLKFDAKSALNGVVSTIFNSFFRGFLVICVHLAIKYHVPILKIVLYLFICSLFKLPPATS